LKIEFSVSSVFNFREASLENDRTRPEGIISAGQVLVYVRRDGNNSACSASLRPLIKTPSAFRALQKPIKRGVQRAHTHPCACGVQKIESTVPHFAKIIANEGRPRRGNTDTGQLFQIACKRISYVIGATLI